MAHPTKTSRYSGGPILISGIWLRILVWLGLAGLLYVLRAFALLIFLTFVFAFIQARGVRRLESYIKSRPLRTVMVGLSFLATLIIIGIYLAPRLAYEARLFAERFPGYVRALDSAVVDLAQQNSTVNFFLSEHFSSPNRDDSSSAGFGNSVTIAVSEQLFGLGQESGEPNTIRAMVESAARLGGSLLAIGSAFLLALLLSFLIVLDLGPLSRGIIRLRDSHVSWIYNEVAPSIKNFAMVLGRALEAQLFIALLNTALTIPGLILLGLGDKVIFLSVIVFLCSFIPVAGVFISSAPICLIVIQQEGWATGLVAAGYITLIHLIEAYILNPRIYGHHLRLNPVVVLIILTVGGKLFGVWGLVLGVPVCTYLYSVMLGKPIESQIGLKN